MKKSYIILVIVVLLIIIGGLIWWQMSYKTPATYQAPSSYETNQSPAPTPEVAPPAQLVQGTVIMTLNTGSDAKLGTYLVASNGMTLYTYAKDTNGVSNCSGACAVNWPPYIATASSLKGAATITGAISTIIRADGTTQVTYKGMPLYFWKNDAKPGDTTGQGVGGVWTVAKQ